MDRWMDGPQKSGHRYELHALLPQRDETSVTLSVTGLSS